MDTNKTSSRRGVIRAGLGVAAAGAALAGISAGKAQAQSQKIAQNLVQYQPTPKDGNRCDACVNWQAPNACTIVEGTIAPAGWCVAFAPKAG